MSAQWRAAAHAGELDVVWLTPKRAIADGHTVPPHAVMVGMVYPHGEQPLPIVFSEVARIFAFTQEMRPVVCRVLGTDKEDVSALQAALVGSEVPGEGRVH